MSAFEIKIVAPELASALNRLADAISGQGQLPLTGTAEFVPTSELAKETVKAEAPKKTTTRVKPKPAAEEKTADAAGDAEPAEDTSSSSTTQNDEPRSDDGDDLTGTHDDDATVTAVTIEVLAKAITDAVTAGHRPAVVEILQSFGAKRGGEVPEEDRADCYAQITGLTKEG